MKTYANSIKVLAINTFIMLFIGCASPLNSTRIPSVEEQCLVLHEKRVNAPKPSGRNKSFKSRKVNLETFPVATNKKEMYVESVQLRPFPAANLYASIAELEVHSVVDSEFKAPELPDRPEITSHNTEYDEVSVKLGISPVSNEIAQSSITKNNFFTTNSAPLLLGASSIFSLLMLSLAQSRSKKISYWASQNPWKARGLIAGTHIVTCVSALTLGHHLYDQHVYISDTVSYGAMAVFSTACLLYPSKNPAISFTHSYFAQKANDIALFTSGAVLVLCAGNHYQVTQQPIANTEIVYSITPNSSSEKSLHLVKNKKDFKEEKRKLKQEIKKERSGGEKAALTLLVLIAFAAAAYGLAALSCSIACSGNEALAAVVGIGGGIGLIALLILAFRAIYGNKRKSKKVEEATEA